MGVKTARLKIKKKEKQVQRLRKRKEKDEKVAEMEVDSDAEQDIVAESKGKHVTIGASKLKGNSIRLSVAVAFGDCAQKLLISDVVQDLCRKCLLQSEEASGITKVHLKEEKGEMFLECEGSNLTALHLLPEGTVDIDHLQTNDIAKVLGSYGVEAARAAIVKEVNGVFGHFGITVNHRHLSLIADYMTQTGKFRPFNRIGLKNCTSPILQMSFETTMAFLTESCAENLRDAMKSPASSIVIGQVPTLGTGAVSLVQDLTAKPPSRSVQKRNFSFR